LSRRLLAVTLTLLVIGAIVVAVRQPVPKPIPPSDADTPQACVNRMLAAEENGDPVAYLDCISGEYRVETEARWSKRTSAEKTAELQGLSAGLVGRTLNDVQLDDPNHARLVLERVSQDYIERQQILLSRESSRWKITRIGEPQRHRPSIRYGTPVTNDP
jgi:hypothetical protein